MVNLLEVLEILKIYILSMVMDNPIWALMLMILRQNLQKIWSKLIKDMQCLHLTNQLENKEQFQKNLLPISMKMPNLREFQESNKMLPPIKNNKFLKFQNSLNKSRKLSWK